MGGTQSLSGGWGWLEIDNNLMENALRPSCIGKKNYLFFGCPEAEWRSAVMYSIIVSCRGARLIPGNTFVILCADYPQPRITTSCIW